jgi:hypothetical protein
LLKKEEDRKKHSSSSSPALGLSVEFSCVEEMLILHFLLGNWLIEIGLR